MGCSGSKGGHEIAKPASPQDNSVKRSSVPQTAGQEKQCVALHDFEARSDKDLAFKKGDRISVFDTKNKDWWQGRCGDKEGFFPSSYVVSIEEDIGPWFHADTSRREAERLLLDTKVGTFLLRPRETNTSGSQGYSLSVRALQPPEPNRDLDIRHYKINSGDKQFYISEKTKFPSLTELVSFYQHQDDVGLCIKLGDPCPRPTPYLNDLSVETADKWEIPRSEINFIEQLGSGQFGEVWLALWRGKTKVAVKTLKTGTMKPENFLSEAQLMKRLQHKHLIRLYAVCSKEEPMYIVTELAQKGCLLKFLREGEGKKFELSQLIGMGADVADAMVYLENINYIHRDLAARNVLVDDHNRCKVCDFGLARCLKQEESTYLASKGSKFPIKWTAPEAIAYGHFTIKSDVWSFGVVLYELVTKGKVPYPGMSNREVMEQVENGYRMPCPETSPDHLYKIMRACWHSDSQRRPTFEYLFRALSEYTALAEKQYG